MKNENEGNRVRQNLLKRWETQLSEIVDQLGNDITASDGLKVNIATHTAISSIEQVLADIRDKIV